MQGFLSKYLTNVTGLQIFQLLRFGVVFLTGILLVDGGLSTTDLGVYEKLLFLAGLLSFFWVSGIIQSLLSAHTAFKEQEQEGALFFNTALVMLVCSLLAAFTFYTLANNSPNYLAIAQYSKPFAANILLLGPAFLVEYIYLLRRKPNSILLYGILVFSAQLLAVTLPIYLGYGLLWSVYGLLVVAGARFAWLVFLLLPLGNCKPDWQVMASMLKLSWPLVLSGLLAGSAEYIDGFLVTYYYDDAHFAIFRYGARELPLFYLIAAAFSNSMVPEIAAANPAFIGVLGQIKKNSLAMMHIFFPITAVLMLLSPFLYPLLFKPEFVESANIFNIYLLLIISRLIFPQTILIGMQKNKLIFGASFLEMIINIGLSIILIQWFGLVGVAAATVIASIGEKLILAYFVHKILGINPSAYVNIKWLAFYSIIVLMLFGVLNILT